MPTVKDIYKAIDRIAPFDTALEFDNAGLLVEREDGEVKTVAVCLDITEETVNSAKNVGAELIVSHHPVIFSPLKKLNTASPVYMLAKADIAAICAHTNLDAAAGGVNDALAEALGMTDVTPLSDGDDRYPPMARMGFVPEMTADRFAAYVKEKLGCGAVKYVPSNGTVKKIAVCGGAGEEFIFAAMERDCDALVTGESKHHINLIAKQNGFGFYACGHFATEQVVKIRLADFIKSEFPELNVIVLDETDPAKYL